MERKLWWAGLYRLRYHSGRREQDGTAEDRGSTCVACAAANPDPGEIDGSACGGHGEQLGRSQQNGEREISR